MPSRWDPRDYADAGPSTYHRERYPASGESRRVSRHDAPRPSSSFAAASTFASDWDRYEARSSRDGFDRVAYDRDYRYSSARTSREDAFEASYRRRSAELRMSAAAGSSGRASARPSSRAVWDERESYRGDAARDIRSNGHPSDARDRPSSASFSARHSASKASSAETEAREPKSAPAHVVASSRGDDEEEGEVPRPRQRDTATSPAGDARRHAPTRERPLSRAEEDQRRRDVEKEKYLAQLKRKERDREGTRAEERPSREERETRAARGSVGTNGDAVRAPPHSHARARSPRADRQREIRSTRDRRSPEDDELLRRRSNDDGRHRRDRSPRILARTSQNGNLETNGLYVERDVRKAQLEVGPGLEPWKGGRDDSQAARAGGSSVTLASHDTSDQREAGLSTTTAKASIVQQSSSSISSPATVSSTRKTDADASSTAASSPGGSRDLVSPQTRAEDKTGPAGTATSAASGGDHVAAETASKWQPLSNRSVTVAAGVSPATQSIVGTHVSSAKHIPTSGSAGSAQTATATVTASLTTGSVATTSQSVDTTRPRGGLRSDGVPLGPKALYRESSSVAAAVVASPSSAFLHSAPPPPETEPPSPSPPPPPPPPPPPAEEEPPPPPGEDLPAPRLADALLTSQPPPPPDEAASPPPPPPPPTPPRPPAPLSFGFVPLPHELEPHPKLRNWRVVYDPALDSTGAKGKEVLRTYAGDGDAGARPQAADPRRRAVGGSVAVPPSGSRRKARPFVHLLHWEWDVHSTAPKPPPPPRGLLVTGLSPLTTLGAINQHFRTFGRIDESELKLDPKTGQSLGIYYVRFAHDFDEDGRSKRVSAVGAAQKGHEVAKRALADTNGQRLGTEKVTVAFDGDRTAYVRTYRTELGKRYPPRTRSKAATSTASVSTASDSAPKASTPAAPARGSSEQGTAAPFPAKGSRDPRQWTRDASGISSPLGEGRASPRTHPGQTHLQAAHRLGLSGSSSPAPRATMTKRADDDDDMDMGSDSEEAFKAASARSRAEQPRRARRGADEDFGDDTLEPTSTIFWRLATVGMPYVFVPRVRSSAIGARDIRRHFNGFLPASVSSDESGWYVAFKSRDAAHRCKMVMDKSTVCGYHISIEVRTPPSRNALAADPRGGHAGVARPGLGHAPATSSGLATGPAPAPPAPPAPRQRRKVVKSWSDAELAEEARHLILRELGDVLVRDLRNRVVNPFIADFLLPTSAGGKVLYAPVEEPKPEAPNLLDDERDYVRPRSFRRKSPPPPPATVEAAPPPRKGPSGSRRRRLEDARTDRAGDLAPERGTPSDLASARASEDEEDEAESERARRVDGQLEADARGEEAAAPPAKPKAKAVKKQKRVKIAVDESEDDEGRAKLRKVDAATTLTPDEATGERQAEDDETPAPGAEHEAVAKPVAASKKAAKKATTAALQPPRQRSPTPDPFSLGLAEDEEDLYFVRLALQRMANGEAVTSAALPESLEAGMDGEAEPHATGSARTEGFYKIAPSQKAEHLPDRNKAVVDPSTAAVGLASARDNRADSRRLVQGIEQHKRETATDTDILKFNQLRSRKKQLKFAKSPIHDWGLYAMELIPAGDMVIEYVGEIIRQQVADEREKQYERQGNFSTYLFRVDDDLVVDATRKGNIARLMNHCCTPNCTAKILTLNGEKRIVLFAKNTILPGQELTYDYKFQSSGDENDAIPCLCGSPGCRRFL